MKKISMYDDFIEKYKELERLLDVPVREYEDTLDETTAGRLRLCRMFRNYIQHNADYKDMLVISDGMYDFLSDLIYALRCQNGILKDHMMTVQKYGMLSESDTVLDAAVLLTKKKRESGVVLDKNGNYIGHITKSIISDLFGSGSITKATKIHKIKDMLVMKSYESVLQTSPMDDVHRTINENNCCIFAINNASRIVGVYNV